MLLCWLCLAMVSSPLSLSPGALTMNTFAGGSLVTQGAISVGDLTSLLLYTVYVGSGLQMLT